MTKDIMRCRLYAPTVPVIVGAYSFYMQTTQIFFLSTFGIILKSDNIQLLLNNWNLIYFYDFTDVYKRQ